MTHRLFAGLMILLVAFAVSACGGSAPPAADQPAASAPAKPAVDPADMDAHFGKVRELQDAVVRGDLEGAKSAAQWIADHQDAAGLPAGTEAYMTTTKNAARAVAASASLGNAGIAGAFAVSACGECHAAAKVTAKLPEAAAPATVTAAAEHMRAHQHAVELMYRGMVAPSDALWKQGAEALKASALTDKDKAKAAKDVVAAEARVHELAAHAADAADAGSRIAIYGELTAACATCHASHGRVLGAGLPKGN